MTDWTVCKLGARRFVIASTVVESIVEFAPPSPSPWPSEAWLGVTLVNGAALPVASPHALVGAHDCELNLLLIVRLPDGRLALPAERIEEVAVALDEAPEGLLDPSTLWAAPMSDGA